MRGWTLMSLLVFVGVLVGCGNSASVGQSEDPGSTTATPAEGTSVTQPAGETSTTGTTNETSTVGITNETSTTGTTESTTGQRFALRTEEVPLQSPTTAVGFGLGSLWLADVGDYECDDTGGGACAAPQTMFLRAMSPEGYEISETVPFNGVQDAAVAFGAGSVWVSAIPQNPSSGGLFRVDPETGEVLSRLPVDASSGMAFGEGSVWVTSESQGTLLRVDPGTGKATADIKVSAGGANDVAVGESGIWVANWGPVSGPAGQDRFGGKKLVRVDGGTNEVVAEVPIEENALEGGASNVAVDEETGAVWVTSVNGKLFRLDPASNRTVAEIGLGAYAWEVETFAGDAWVIYETGINDPSAGASQRVARIDSATNRIVGSVKAAGASDLAAGEDALWVASSNMESGTGTLTRIVP